MAAPLWGLVAHRTPTSKLLEDVGDIEGLQQACISLAIFATSSEKHSKQAQPAADAVVVLLPPGVKTCSVCTRVDALKLQQRLTRSFKLDS
jgi:hypothetical protein